MTTLAGETARKALPVAAIDLKDLQKQRDPFECRPGGFVDGAHHPRAVTDLRTVTVCAALVVVGERPRDFGVIAGQVPKRSGTLDLLWNRRHLGARMESDQEKATEQDTGGIAHLVTSDSEIL